MRFITFLVTTLFAAAYATPLDGGLIDPPSPDSIVPAPVLTADTFPTPAGNQVFPATDGNAITEAKLDISDDPDKQGIQVASAPASPSDEDLKLFDASNADQLTFSTSLNLPADLLKTDFTVSASDASDLETACVDSSTESAPKVRRDELSDYLDYLREKLSPNFEKNTAPNSCSWHPTQRDPSTDAVPSLLPKPTRPGPPRPQLLPTPGNTPSPRPDNPDDPDDKAGHWNYPVISGGRGLGGDQSCKGIFGDYWKIFTLVCGGPSVDWYGETARSVMNCQSGTCIFFNDDIRSAHSSRSSPQSIVKR